MTPHKVECFEHNGEPYGRYVLPEGFEHSFMMIGWTSPSSFINANTFAMPGAEIGKTYERDELEIVWQISEKDEDSAFSFDWIDDDFGTHRKYAEDFPDDYRQIFRLVISKMETTPQPVEKEPELTPEQYFEITGFHTPKERKAYEKGFEAKEKVMIEFIEKWDGSTNSGLGELLDRKFKEWLPNQP